MNFPPEYYEKKIDPPINGNCIHCEFPIAMTYNYDMMFDCSDGGPESYNTSFHLCRSCGTAYKSSRMNGGHTLFSPYQWYAIYEGIPDDDMIPSDYGNYKDRIDKNEESGWDYIRDLQRRLAI